MSLRLLTKIAVGGAIFTAVTGVFMENMIGYRLKQGSFYTQSMSIIRSSSAVKELMGEPIRDLSINLGNKTNRVDNTKANLQVELKGPKTSGVALIEAERANTDEDWKLKRLEMTFDSQPDKKLVVYKDEK
ncbi:hypothetical protein CHUAL_008871 [Chamberlinius hualienensis]